MAVAAGTARDWGDWKRPSITLSSHSLRGSLCDLFTCDSSGFLTAWWPQDSQPTYLAAQASSPNVPANQVEAASCFMAQC